MDHYESNCYKDDNGKCGGKDSGNAGCQWVGLEQ